MHRPLPNGNSRRSSVKKEKDANLPDALLNIAGAVEALNDAINDAINKAETDPNLSDVGKDLVTVAKDVAKAVEDIL